MRQAATPTDRGRPRIHDATAGDEPARFLRNLTSLPDAEFASTYSPAVHAVLARYAGLPDPAAARRALLLALKAALKRRRAFILPRFTQAEDSWRIRECATYAVAIAVLVEHAAAMLAPDRADEPADPDPWARILSHPEADPDTPGSTSRDALFDAIVPARGRRWIAREPLVRTLIANYFTDAAPNELRDIVAPGGRGVRARAPGALEPQGRGLPLLLPPASGTSRPTHRPRTGRGSSYVRSRGPAVSADTEDPPRPSPRSSGNPSSSGARLQSTAWRTTPPSHRNPLPPANVPTRPPCPSPKPRPTPPPGPRSRHCGGRRVLVIPASVHRRRHPKPLHVRRAPKRGNAAPVADLLDGLPPRPLPLEAARHPGLHPLSPPRRDIGDHGAAVPRVVTPRTTRAAS